MRKIIALILALTMLMSVCALDVFAYQHEDAPTITSQLFIQDKTSWSWIAAGYAETAVGKTSVVKTEGPSNPDALKADASDYVFKLEVVDKTFDSSNKELLGETSTITFTVSDIVIKADGYSDYVYPGKTYVANLKTFEQWGNFSGHLVDINFDATAACGSEDKAEWAKYFKAINGVEYTITYHSYENPNGVKPEGAPFTKTETLTGTAKLTSKGGDYDAAEYTNLEGVNLVAAGQYNIQFLDITNLIKKVCNLDEILGFTVSYEMVDQETLFQRENGKPHIGLKGIKNGDNKNPYDIGSFNWEAEANPYEMTGTIADGTTSIYIDASGFGKTTEPIDIKVTVKVTHGTPSIFIGDAAYYTLQSAIDDAKEGDTITFKADVEGAGVKVPAGKNITIDLNKHTYTINKGTGSGNITSCGMQLLSGSTVTIKNGKITTNADEVKLLIQKYGDLTLTDVDLDATGTQVDIAVSNNSGETVIDGSTSITVDAGKAAFDVYLWETNYPNGVDVTIDTTGTITGDIQIGGKLKDGTTFEQACEKLGLTVESGTFEGKFVTDDKALNFKYTPTETKPAETTFDAVKLQLHDGYAGGYETVEITKTGHVDYTANVTSTGDFLIFKCIDKNFPAGMKIKFTSVNIDGTECTIKDELKELTLADGKLELGINTNAFGSITGPLLSDSISTATTVKISFDVIDPKAAAVPSEPTEDEISAAMRKALAANGAVTLNGGIYSDKAVADFVEDYTETEDGKYSVSPAITIKEVSGSKYETLQEAVTAAEDGQTVVVNVDLSGSGVKIEENKKVNIDLTGHKYTVTEPLVGSTGFETNGFQILKGAVVTISNGTITTSSDKCIILIQNYANLTLNDVDAIGTASVDYVISNNFGSLAVNGDSDITAAEGKAAFDVFYGLHEEYADGVTVTINTTGKVTGNVEIGAADSAAVEGKSFEEICSKIKLNILSGTFDGKFVVDGESLGYKPEDTVTSILSESNYKPLYGNSSNVTWAGGTVKIDGNGGIVLTLPKTVKTGETLTVHFAGEIAEGGSALRAFLSPSGDSNASNIEMLATEAGAFDKTVTFTHSSADCNDLAIKGPAGDTARGVTLTTVEIIEKAAEDIDLSEVRKAMGVNGNNTVVIADGCKFNDANVRDFIKRTFRLDSEYFVSGSKPVAEGDELGQIAHIYINEEYHGMFINGHLLVYPHVINNDIGYCPVCHAVIPEVEEEEDIVVVDPTEPVDPQPEDPSDDEPTIDITEPDDEPKDEVPKDENPPMGIALAVIPMMVAAACVAVSKKR